MSDLGKRIKSLRIEKGLTQEQLGKILNVGKSTISQYENNINTPDTNVIKKLADYFCCSVDYLLGRTDERNGLIIPEEKYPYNVNSNSKKFYEMIARAKVLPKRNIEQISDALEALLKHHEEKIKHKKSQGKTDI